MGSRYSCLVELHAKSGTVKMRRISKLCVICNDDSRGEMTVKENLLFVERLVNNGFAFRMLPASVAFLANL